jgi:hypothetical protein
MCVLSRCLPKLLVPFPCEPQQRTLAGGEAATDDSGEGGGAKEVLVGFDANSCELPRLGKRRAPTQGPITGEGSMYHRRPTPGSDLPLPLCLPRGRAPPPRPAPPSTPAPPTWTLSRLAPAGDEKFQNLAPNSTASLGLSPNSMPLQKLAPRL